MKKLILTDEDMHNLYDLCYMVDYGTIKLNKMDKWLGDFQDRLEPLVCEELSK